MRRGPFALAFLVVLALCAFSTSAWAGSSTDGDEDPWCVSGEAERVLLISELRPRPVTPPPPAVPTDAQLCVRGILGADCQMHDPAQRPAPPTSSIFASPDLVFASVPELPEPDTARVSLAPHALGAPRPGFDRGLFRPPRV